MLNTYQIKVVAHMPCPRELDVRVNATKEHMAAARALRIFRQQLAKGKKLDTWQLFIKKL